MRVSVSVSMDVTAACRRGSYTVLTSMYPHWAATALAGARILPSQHIENGKVLRESWKLGILKAPYHTNGEVGPGDGAELGSGQG